MDGRTMIKYFLLTFANQATTGQIHFVRERTVASQERELEVNQKLFKCVLWSEIYDLSTKLITLCYQEERKAQDEACQETNAGVQVTLMTFVILMTLGTLLITKRSIQLIMMMMIRKIQLLSLSRLN